MTKQKKVLDALIVGAGPIGVECSVNFKVNDVTHLLLDRHGLASTILRWSDRTHFLSTTERLEIAQVPLQTEDQQSPTGGQYIAYLRSIVEIFNLPLLTFRNVGLISREGSYFKIEVTKHGIKEIYYTANVVLATGGMSQPAKLTVPGATEPFVRNAESTLHDYFRTKVLVVGDGNSALEQVIRLFRMGVEVTLLTPDEALDLGRIRMEYAREWNLLCAKDKVKHLPSGELKRIHPSGKVEYASRKRLEQDTFDFIIAAIGYDYDQSLLRRTGIHFANGQPVYDEQSMQTNIPGIYLAGTVAGGSAEMEKFFIGTCHDHIHKIIHHMVPKPKTIRTGSPESRDYSFCYSDVQYHPSKLS